MAERYHNKQELHWHAGVPCHSDNVKGILGVGDELRVALSVYFSAKEARKDDALYRH